MTIGMAVHTKHPSQIGVVVRLKQQKPPSQMSAVNTTVKLNAMKNTSKFCENEFGIYTACGMSHEFEFEYSGTFCVNLLNGPWKNGLMKNFLNPFITHSIVRRLHEISMESLRFYCQMVIHWIHFWFIHFSNKVHYFQVKFACKMNFFDNWQNETKRNQTKQNQTKQKRTRRESRNIHCKHWQK